LTGRVDWNTGVSGKKSTDTDYGMISLRTYPGRSEVSNRPGLRGFIDDDAAKSRRKYSFIASARLALAARSIVGLIYHVGAGERPQGSD
jgi:hypothetical protein